ncbi:unnamed protein product [Orchesella dallaii]|uniref:Uncharacterized protein n=1 Tax=Orchesella dallaii TaxID=48710 RepID=A0ABP1R0U0_9HEXA
MGGSYPLLLAFAGAILFTVESIKMVQAEEPYPEDMEEHNLNKRDAYGYGGYTPPSYPPPTATYSAPPTYAAPMPTYAAPAPMYAAPTPIYAAPTYAAPTYASPPPYYSYPSYYPSGASYTYNYNNSSSGSGGSNTCNCQKCEAGPPACKVNDPPPCTCTEQKHPDGCTQTKCGTDVPGRGNPPYKCICNTPNTPAGCTPESTTTTTTTQGADLLGVLLASGNPQSTDPLSVKAGDSMIVGTKGSKADLELLSSTLGSGLPTNTLLGGTNLLGSAGGLLDVGNAGLLDLGNTGLLDGSSNVLGGSPLALLNIAS